MEYKHTTEMEEISGFGGGYEDACQDMLHAGVTWLIERKEKPDLQGHTYKNVTGIFSADSDDAKEMEKVVVGATDGCSGAMVQAVMQRLFWISHNSWDAYCTEVTALKSKG